MKVLAPLRSSGEVGPLAAAGAHEFYCGVAPPFWAEAYPGVWANRRDPRSAGVPDLEDLQAIVAAAGERPVYVTLNAPRYPAGAVDRLVGFGRELVAERGAAGLIVADWELLLALAEAGLAGRVHVSSLATCLNPGAAAFFRDLGFSRIVLPRHLTLAEIEAARVPGIEFEVFALNDGCVFEEGLCATTHSFGPFCLEDGPGTDGLPAERLDQYAFWKWTLNNCGCRTSRSYPLGPCGLCALPRFLELGVASLKVVGREASLARKQASVELTARALELAESGAAPADIREAVGGLRGARSLCGGAHLCYYPDVWAEAGEADGSADRREAAAC